MVNFEARAPKLYTHVLGLNIRHFCQIGKIKFPSSLVLGRVKSAIGLIFKMVSFEARAPKLYTYVLGLNVRLFCQICKIDFYTPLVQGVGRGVKSAIGFIFKTRKMQLPDGSCHYLVPAESWN